MLDIKQEIETYKKKNIICRINDTIEFYVSNTTCVCDSEKINNRCINCVYSDLIDFDVDYYAITKYLYDTLKMKKLEYVFVFLDFYVWATTDFSMEVVLENIIYDKISSEACERDFYV